MTSQAEKFVRTLCAVSALMLLLAVDKTCPWLVARPEPASANPLDDHPPDGDDPKSPPAVVLRAVPPDAIAPRTSGAAFDVAAHGVASSAHHAVASAPPDPARVAPTSEPRPAPPGEFLIAACVRASNSDAVSTIGRTAVRPQQDPAIRTSLRPLAPPGV
ncbi:MAG: hypothetical protein AB7Q17_11990 [Phycisphaerae bacterium]